MLKKIAIIGPESTGKTTLCEQLAQHYNSLWCPEYAREYLLTHGTKYSYEDLLAIAKGQVELEKKFELLVRSQESGVKPEFSHSPLPTPAAAGGLPQAQPHSLLFIDTNMYVMKVWCEFVFGKCHQFILDQVKKRKYDLYLLCNTDLPWTPDELREYPDPGTRQKLYLIYKDHMINQTVPWVEISGDSEQRLKKAIQSVELILKKG